MKYLSWTVLVLFASMCLGCGGSQDASTKAPATSPSPAGSAAVASDAGSPSEAVGRFYDALRMGDATAIAELLTDKAREETARSGLDIRTQGSTTLSYELGEIDYVTDAGDGAHVKSLWTETDSETGQAMTSEVIWVLRKQPNGWRIAGMATPVVEGQLPLLFNFEDPEDMMWKKNYIENEMAGTSQPADSEVYDAAPNENAAPAVEQATVPADGELR